MRISDWSSDVCSSDLRQALGIGTRIDITRTRFDGADTRRLRIGADRDLGTRTERDAGLEFLDPALTGEQRVGQRGRARDIDNIDIISARTGVVERLRGDELAIGISVQIAAFAAVERIVALAAEDEVDRKSTRLNSSH